MGDALAHALLPGAALGFLLGGLSLPAMSLGGFWPASPRRWCQASIARFTTHARGRELRRRLSHRAWRSGVLIVSLRGSAVDLMNILFGAILAVDDTALLLVRLDRDAHPGRARRRSTGRWSSNASTRASCAAMGVQRLASITISSWRSPC